MDNEDIDEIINHIQKIKETDSQNDLLQKKSNNTDNQKINCSNGVEQNNVEESIKTIELNENKLLIEAMEKIRVGEPISIMKPKFVGWTDESIVACDLCDQKIILGKNLSGLVIANEFFACENCCQKLNREELMEWTKSKMISPSDVRPIGLWVIEQQSKSRNQEIE
jgi:hypothetical protein